MGLPALVGFLVCHVEQAPGKLVVLSAQGVAELYEDQGDVLEDLAFGDVLGEEPAQVPTACFAGGNEGVAVHVLGLPFRLLLLGELGGRPAGLGPRGACGIGADGDDLAGGVDAGGMAGLGGPGLRRRR